MSNQRHRLAILNDQLHRDFSTGQVVITRCIAELGDEVVSRVLKAVSEFSDFNENNDPWGERDAGSFEIDQQQLMWKIDYFDLDLSMYSPDPSNPAVTRRVLTILKNSEY